MAQDALAAAPLADSIDPAAAAAAVIDVVREGMWERLGGGALEAALTVDAELGDSPVRLVCAHYLIALAKSGKTLVRRQDVPAEAFVSLDRMRRMAVGAMTTCMRVVCISHPWLQPDHPDPRGDTLRNIARVLEQLVAGYATTTKGLSGGGGTYGVFLDFVSLHQKDENGARTAAEGALFGRALGGLSEWYAHPRTIVLKQTALPTGYPAGFTFPQDVTPNQADYHGRGWCFCESALSNLVKDHNLVLDLGMLPADPTACLGQIIEACRARREAPLAPERFCERLETKSFTSKKADLITVGEIYRKGFTQRLAASRALVFLQLGWGDREAIDLAGAIESGSLSCVEELLLGENQIGSAGITAMMSAAAGGGLTALRVLSLGENQIGADGMKAIERAVDGGALPAIEKIVLYGNEPRGKAERLFEREHPHGTPWRWAP